MRFLCDVHISYKVVHFLRSAQVDAIHVNDILDKWHTTDRDICNYADANDMIVITKDSDFKNGYLVNKTPRKLVKVNLGNMSTSLLIQIISENMQSIINLNSKGSFMIELNRVISTFIQREP